MKKIFIIITLISILIIAVLTTVIIVLNNLELVAKINIAVPSMIEEQTDYTYNIYKLENGKYIYEKIKIESWLSEVTSEKKVAFGIINNKEDLNVIRKDITDNYYEIEVIRNETDVMTNNITIEYNSIELNTLDELAEKMFGI